MNRPTSTVGKPAHILQSGGGYYFHNLAQKPQDEAEKSHVSLTVSSSDEFCEWKEWMKGYLKDKNKPKPDPSKSSTTNPSNQYINWISHVQEAQEFQKKQSHDLASAIQHAKQDKIARMFQKRFERSEKYSLVSEPGDKRETVSSRSVSENENHVEVNNGEEESTEEEESSVCESNEVADIQNYCENHSQGQISSSVEIAVPVEPTTLSYLVTPQPWKFKTEPLPPPPPQTDFNRSPRGFAGTYVTPYF